MTTLPTADRDSIATIRQQHAAGQSITSSEIDLLLNMIDERQVQVVTAPIQLSRAEYAALAAGYNLLWHALEQAGLHLERETRDDFHGAPWVWFYWWEGGSRTGPFGTLEATVVAAIGDLRAGSDHRRF